MFGEQYVLRLNSQPFPRYNAQVMEVVGEGRYRLLYTDYGNEEIVEAGRIVTSLKSLGGELVDPGVHQQWSTQTSIEDVEDSRGGRLTSLDASFARCFAF